MRIPHLLSLMATTGAAVLMAAPVAAEPAYPLPSPTLIVKPAMVAACGTVFIRGTGYGPNERVEVTVVTTPAAAPPLAADGLAGRSATIPAVGRITSAEDGQTVRANPEGSFEISLGLSSIGGTIITATGTDSGRSAAAVATVLPPACSSVPVVGRLSGHVLWTGAMAVVGGTVLVAISTVLWRQRRHQRANR